MQKILVPIDFSPNSINALKYADALAQRIEATLVLLHVYTGNISNYDAGWPIDEPFAAVKKDFENDMELIIKDCCHVNATYILKEGDAIKEIINTARDSKSDLIVMGTHGATGLTRVFFGSNTAHVFSHSPIPVLAIPQNFAYDAIHKIIYATDLRNFEYEIKVVQAFSGSLGAKIEALHLNYESQNTLIEIERFDSLRHNSLYKNITFTQKNIPMESTLIDYLRTYINSEKNTILAMFTQDKTWLDRVFMNSITEDMAFDLQIPLLAMKKLG